MIELNWRPGSPDETAIKADYQAETGQKFTAGVIKREDGEYLARVRNCGADILNEWYPDLTYALLCIESTIQQKVDQKEASQQRQADEREQVKIDTANLLREAQVWRP